MDFAGRTGVASRTANAPPQPRTTLPAPRHPGLRLGRPVARDVRRRACSTHDL